MMSVRIFLILKRLSQLIKCYFIFVGLFSLSIYKKYAFSIDFLEGFEHCGLILLVLFSFYCL